MKGDARLDSKSVIALETAFEESDLPYTVDVVDLNRVSDRFRQIVDAQKAPLPLDEDGTVHALSNDWREVAIGDIADVVGGSTPSTKDAANFNGDIPWLTPKDLSGPHDRYIARGERNLSQKGLDSCSAKLLPAGSVLLSTRAPIGYVALAKNPIATNQGFRSLIVREGVSSDYLYYWLLQNTDELKRLASGSTFGELSGSSLKTLPVPLPPLPEQRAIAHILGTLDDKIELNRRMNQTLEEMARAIFKDWFIDFGPTRAKIEGREPYLPPEVWALFPDRLVESELGPIPAGWRVGTVGDVTDTVGGTTPSTRRLEYWDDGIHCWATPKDLASLSAPVILETERKITDSGLRRVGSGLQPPGTVLMSSRAPIGYLAITEVPVAINQGFIALQAHEGISNLFLIRWCEAFHEEIINYANGSTFLEISKRDFRRIPMSIPGKSVMDAFDTQARTLHERIVANEREALSLTGQRDVLLPKLVSGEFRVREIVTT